MCTCRTEPIGHVRRVPATFQACQNPSSIVGADVCPTVLWEPSIPILGKHGKTPHMSLGIDSVLGAVICHTW